MRGPAIRIARRIALLAAPLLTATADLCAQDARSVDDSLAAARGGWLGGMSVGVPGHGREAAPELLTIGGNWTHVRAGRVGADFALGTMPRILGEGFVVIGARAGIALPLVVAPNVLLLPSGGVSVLGGAGSGGGGGVAGWNVGMATVLFGGNGAGFRTGVTWHRFDADGDAIWLWEVGFVRGPRPH